MCTAYGSILRVFNGVSASSGRRWVLLALALFLLQSVSVSTLLAQQATSAPAGPNGAPIETAPQRAPEQMYGNLPLDDIWSVIVGINWLPAVMILAMGVIVIMYGWRLFKALVIMNFGLVGMFVGIRMGGHFAPAATGEGAGVPIMAIWAGVIGALGLAFAAYFFMKYAISILGALAGAILGGALWRMMTLPDQLIWVGGLSGLIAGGFMAFSSYKLSIMLFTCLQGAAALSIGTLALLHDYPNMAMIMARAVYGYNFFLPLCVLLPTFVGLVCQRRMLQAESKWSLPEK